MKHIIALIIVGIGLASCRTDSGNEKLAGATEKVGKSAATAIKGIKAGIEKVTKINIQVSEAQIGRAHV